jgi:hypothetical protein
LQKINKIQGVTYAWKDEKKGREGQLESGGLKMKLRILAVIIVLLLTVSYSYAGDVLIDSDGNITTGSMNPAINLVVESDGAEDAIAGVAQGSAAGVYGVNTDDNNYGILGYGDYGVYGYSASEWAGYFQGSVNVTDNLTVEGTLNATVGNADTVDGSHAADFAPASAFSTHQSDVQAHHSKTSSFSELFDSASDAQIPDNITINYALTAGDADTLDGIASTGYATSSHTHTGSLYSKVAIVAQSGGDYTDPLTAMTDIAAWCGTPSATNPCLVRIMPGIYDLGNNGLEMQPYVDIYVNSQQ